MYKLNCSNGRTLRHDLGSRVFRGTIRVVMRIGAVNYLNSKPLVYGLDSLAPQVRVTYDLPSRLQPVNSLPNVWM